MDQNDEKRRMWCSTKVDDSGFHKSGGGNWGYCRNDCKGSRYKKNNKFFEITKSQPNNISQDYSKRQSATVLPSRTKEIVSGIIIIW